MEENTMIPSDLCEATSTCNSYRKDSFLQKLNCAINRQNDINMGCNGEDTRAHSAGRVCVPESGQEQPGVYPAGGRPAGPLQVAKSVGQAGFTALEFGRLPQRSQAEAKDDFPTRHSWDSYFRDAKHMNELKAGERPDTIHITGLPVKWFVEDGASVPSESLICKIFKKWGTLRKVDVPAADPYRSRMRLGNNIHKFSYEDGIFFDAFVQYNEYMDFVKAMDALRGMKLLKKDDQNTLTATIKVDFDKTKHMSDSSVSHREFERKRLIAQDNLAAEKLRRKEEAEKKWREEQKKKEEANSIARLNRQRKREEKRKRKVLTTFRKQEEDKVSMKIAREEKKLIKAQRQLESIRLLDELLDRIKIKVENNEIKLNQSVNAETKKDEKKNDQVKESTSKLDSENDKKNKDKQNKKKKTKKEKKKKKKRKKSQKKRKRNDVSGSNSTAGEEETDEETNKKKLKSVLIRNDRALSSAGAVVPAANLPYAHSYSDSISMSRMPMLPPIATGPYHALRISLPRYPGAQMLRPPMPGYSLIHHHPMLHPPMGRGRRYNPRCDMNSYALTNPYLYNGQYYEYFTHLVDRDSERRESRTRGRRKSRSRSISKTRTKSRSKTRSRSASRSRSARRSDSRSKNRRSRSSSRSRSRRSKSSRSRSRSRSRGRRKSASRSISRRRTRSNSKSKRKSGTRSRSKSKSSSRKRSGSRSKRRSRSRSRSKSRNSLRTRYKKRRGRRSASVVKVTRARSRPISLRRKSRSSSWSLPKSPDRRSCSWSKTIPANNISEQDVNEISNKGIEEEATKTTEVQKEAK
ncbi:A-kinase anchor protein 17A isoform X4 [Polyergus mexicanus]|uniref:A-kinase anchor protein 17A isoform X4 n=1 Tax=Polyergus mexicanus TaxID=615972 RepID=UPI0038B5A2D8